MLASLRVTSLGMTAAKTVPFLGLTAVRHVHVEARLTKANVKLLPASPPKGFFFFVWTACQIGIGIDTYRDLSSFFGCWHVCVAGNYVSVVRSGNLVFLAGHLPYDEQGKLIVGKARFSFFILSFFWHRHPLGCWRG